MQGKVVLLIGFTSQLDDDDDDEVLFVNFHPVLSCPLILP